MINITDYGEVLRNRDLEIYLSNTVLIVIGTVIGFFGNFTVIFFYLVRIKERGERYFIPLLAIVDLFACLASSPFIIMHNTFFYNYPSDIVCRILTFLQVFISGLSGHILLVICFQRYLLVCKPYGPKMTLFWKKMSFALACVFSFVYSIPLIGLSGNKTTHEHFLNHTVETTICKFYAVDSSTKISAYFGFLGLIMVANITITAALYIPVLSRIQVVLSGKIVKDDRHRKISSNTESLSRSTSSIESNTKTLSNSTTKSGIQATDHDSKPDEKACFNNYPNKEPSPDGGAYDTSFNNTTKSKEIVAANNELQPEGISKTRNDFAKRRITVMFFVIILAYILSYLPSVILLILAYAIRDFNFISFTESETIAWTYLSRLVFLNHIVNPFIYSYFDVKFRTELKTSFMCKR
ncbi:5-hydroxytryptamine receptor 1A-like [Mytilus californianus]|uniref:5-hydroxytryptamine receptor 1A-like n=1 Tax=Mytilus californianus TaxID=6549 RepID=UPI0022481CE4|nr:5-hydroxytryptamine receptor 1A-like [Mytilus californianus]